MSLSIKYLVTYLLAALLCKGLSGQKAIELQTMKIDSVYGYKTIKLESSYASIKYLLGPKQSLNTHEYSCRVADTSYLKSNLLQSQTITVSFIDDRVRTIYVQVQDSIHVVGVLENLIDIYGKNYAPPLSQHQKSLTIPYNESFAWFGKRSSLNYAIFCYPLTSGSVSWNGNVTFKSKAMECYASKVLGEKYWPEEEGDTYCPRIDPCTP